MAKYTKKWDKEFTKRYSNAIKELQSLETEFNQMVNDNPDSWIIVFPEESTIEFGKNDGFYVIKSDEDGVEKVNVTLKSKTGMFGFDFTTFDELKSFRNEIIEATDKFNRPIEDKKVTLNDDCEEEDENWEENEYQEYTVQASRTCRQVWTHTVQARSYCEAYRLVNEDVDGSTRDDNDDYDDYGDIDYEII